MRYLSVCSGIEAATCAWHHLGWQPVAFSEVEPFPCAVLAHHYPDVPNLGDMTKFKEWPNDSIDLLVGGTPCQSFSVAGLRKGLDDPRGNLMLTFGAIANKYRPRWLVWENVPGVLSSGGGRDFGAFLGTLAELGYGFAYRILDAQYFGVAQRRRRVFVVGYFGDWRPAAAVLFERESLCGYPAPSRETRQGVAPTSRSGAANGGPESDFDCDGGLIASTLHETAASTPTIAFEPGIAKREGGDSRFIEELAPTLRKDAGDNQVAVVAVNPALKARDYKGPGSDASEDGTGRQTLAPVASCFAIRTANTGANGHGIAKEVSHTLDQAQGQAVAFAQNSRDEVREMEVVGALAARPGMKQTSYIRKGVQVRRLTPRECERLQGFPDDYTNIRPKGKDTPDGPRYKAIGNSMAVPVMRWIGERIEGVDWVAKPKDGE